MIEEPNDALDPRFPDLQASGDSAAPSPDGSGETDVGARTDRGGDTAAPREGGGGDQSPGAASGGASPRGGAVVPGISPSQRQVEATVETIEEIEGLDEEGTARVAVVRLPGGGRGCVRLEEVSVQVQGTGQDGASPPPIGPGSTVRVHPRKAVQLRNFVQIVKAHAAGQPLRARVIAPVKGGLMVNIGQRAFLPASQVELHSVEDLNPYVGRDFPVLVIKVDPRRLNVVVSRRLLLERERKARTSEALAALQVGARVTGTVRTLVAYGAFVDLGGVDALLHTSDLTWGKPRPVQDFVKVGDTIEVVVLRVDADRGRVSVGLKQLRPDPWEGLAERLGVGSEVEGRVVGHTEFGAFVEIEPEVEGMIHVSEMDWSDRPGKPSAVLPLGTVVRAQVIEFDPRRRRIGLSRKSLLPDPWKVLAAELPPGTRVRRPVVGVADFGVFVRLAEGIHGLVPRSEIAWHRAPEDLAVLFPVGTEIEVVVLEIDTERRRASLSLKRAAGDPWETLAERLTPGTRVKGTVVRLADFGAFVEVEPGIEGLVHISQLSEERVEKVSDAVAVGQEVEATVLGVDVRRHRLSLSLRKTPVLDGPVAAGGGGAPPGPAGGGGSGTGVGSSGGRGGKESSQAGYSPDTGKAATSLGDLLRERLGGAAGGTPDGEG